MQVGEGEDPLSEDTLVVECEARRRTLRQIRIANVLFNPGASAPGAVTLMVKTDLACLSGAGSVRVGSTPVEYELAVQSAVGGTFYGSVTFTDEKTGEVGGGLWKRASQDGTEYDFLRNGGMLKC